MPDVKENWLPVPQYEGLYAVSDLGNVMSMNYARIVRGERWKRSLGEI
jgi:NUMOD4 motif